jgi:glutamine cyclotransferase
MSARRRPKVRRPDSSHGPSNDGAARSHLAYWRYGILVLAAAVIGVGVWAAWGFQARPGREAAVPVWKYRVVKAFPHSREAYTQGLSWYDGALFESTGGYGQSNIREVKLDTGEVLRNVPLDPRVFGEGHCVWGERIYLVTWRRGVGFVLDRRTFRVLGRFEYAGEGWGITHDGTHLIMSNGSPTLQFLDPKSFRVVRRLGVRAHGRSLRHLNELEYVSGEIWANVWHTDRIARISPKTGEVVGWIDLTGLMPREELRHKEQVLNGIAFDEKEKRLFVTGKQWPKLFEIQLIPPNTGE